MLKIKGFTLIELLVSLTVAAILLTGLLELYVVTMAKSKATIETVRLQENLQSSLTLMANDIRRAGYSANSKADTGSNANTNPFITSNDISINASQNCILLSYDQNGDGSLPSINAGSDDERYGFRLLNNAIQARPNGTPYSCSAAANEWENITDPNVITITQLTFTKSDKTVDTDGSGAGTSTIVIRTVTISITGQLVSNSSISQTVSMTIKVQNDIFTP